MSLYKRKDTPNWYYKFTCPNGGSAISGSTGTTDRKKAQEFHDRLKADLWDQSKLGVKPKYTWNEAVIRYLHEKSHISSMETVKSQLRWLDPYLNSVALVKIDRNVIDKIRLKKQSEDVMIRTKDGLKSKGMKVKPSTVNRLLELIRSILNAALDWEWIDRVPKFKMVAVKTKRVVWLTKPQAAHLLSVLPLHLSEMARFSLETGLRRSNVTQLKWSQVDLARKIAWIHPDEAKAKKAIPVPLSKVAIEVLLRQRFVKRDPGYEDFIFVYQGKPVYQTATNAWRKACKKIGLVNFRWHDLRHTWASWHIQSGTPKSVLRELGGWQSDEMVENYAHLAAEHLMPFVQSFTSNSYSIATVAVRA